MTEDERTALRYAAEFTMGYYAGEMKRAAQKSGWRALDYQPPPQLVLLVRTLKDILRRWPNPTAELPDD